jgi:multiple sugar transport system permease protein
VGWLKKVDIYLNKPRHAAFVFIAPAVLTIFLFCIIPLLASVLISLLNVTTYFANIHFVGFRNYINAFQDIAFIKSWKVTLLFTVFDVPISICFALLVAGLVQKPTKLNQTFRTVYILPLICSATVIGLMWSLFLNQSIGWGVWLMEGLGFGKVAIFANYKMAIYGIIFISIWRSFGVNSLILVAAMQGISQDLYEAANLDGANKWKQFFNITIPGITSTFWFILITRVIGSFQVFDLIYVITNGGPANSTQSVVNYIYKEAFSSGKNRLGYATAMSEILFVVIMIITILLYGKMVQQESKTGGE